MRSFAFVFMAVSMALLWSEPVHAGCGLLYGSAQGCGSSVTRSQTLGGSTRTNFGNGSSVIESQTLGGSRRFDFSGGGSAIESQTLGGSRRFDFGNGGSALQRETLGGGTRTDFRLWVAVTASADRLTPRAPGHAALNSATGPGRPAFVLPR